MLRLKQMQQQKQQAQQRQLEENFASATSEKSAVDQHQAAETTSKGGTHAAAALLTKYQAASGKKDVAMMSLSKNTGGRNKGKRQNAVELRVQKDLAEMDPLPGTEVDLPDPNNIMKLKVKVTPTDGLYQGATFSFDLDIPSNYPYEPPKATCTTLVYHPNIDLEGHVCLNILRADWMPVLSLGSVIFGLMTLFLEPNPDDPLNKDAAQLMIERPRDFERNVKQSLQGGYVAGKQFPRLVK